VLNGGTVAERTQAVAECWADAEATEQRWRDELGIETTHAQAAE
jgi:hypothetical protein